MDNVPEEVKNEERGHDGLIWQERLAQMTAPLPPDSPYAQIAALQSDLAATRKNLAEAEAQISNRDQQIVDAQAIIASLGQQKASLDQRLEAVTKALEALLPDCEEAADALNSSYNVQDYPANGNTQQDRARNSLRHQMENARAALAGTRDGGDAAFCNGEGTL